MTTSNIHRCSILFLLSPALVFWGILIVGASLGTLSVTSSYLDVFPFGEPLWSGSLLILIGSYMVVAHRPTEQVLSHSSKAQVWFTFATSLAAVCECLLAVAVTVWYSMVVSPILDFCSPEFIRGRSTGTCECSLGFIDPPSLKRTVYRFRDVSDCEELREMLSFFRNVLLAMFAVGAGLAGLTAIFAIKKLRSLGVCGKSGVYVVTPQQTPPMPVGSPHSSPSFSHRSVTAPSSTNYATLSLTSQRLHSTSVHSQPTSANQSPAISGVAAVRPRIISTSSNIRAI